jgi:PAS domain S-box-containing protein
MSGPPGTVYGSEDIAFLRLIGRVVAFAIDDNFNLRQTEAAQRELIRQNERLQRSERELQEVIETIPVMAWSAAADGAAEFFNRRWLDYAGLSADQVQGWGWISAVHPDDLSRLADYWRGVLVSGEPGEIEARLRRFDGVYRWFLFRATPSFNNGRVVKWYGTNTDIEERKGAEQAVAVQNARLQLLLKLTNRVTSNLELRQVLRAVSANIREVMVCDAVHISISDPASGKYRLFALDFPEGKGFVKEELIIEPAGAGKRALETLLPAVRNTADPQEFPSDLYNVMVAEGLKTQCVIPLVSRGRVVGVLAINRRTDDLFLPDEIDFLKEASGQIAIAL